MKLIIGLGNPGPEYKNTRHNTGFQTVDTLAKKLDADFKFEKKFNADIVQTNIDNTKTLLVKPQTFMNESGQSVQTLVSFYKLDPKKDITIIYDDIDLPLGEYKTSGQSSGGHKGMQSIMNSLNYQDLDRFRIGVLSLPKEKINDTSKYILGKFTKKEQKTLEQVINRIVEKIT